jgi:hypothetical protein
LTHAEALVLFEWVAREVDAGRIPFEDPAEQTVLWRVEGQLESTLVEVVSPGYAAAVEVARRAVQDPGE